MKHIHLIVASLLAMFASNALAQSKSCIELKNTAQQAQQYTDEQGKPASRLVELGKVVPGTEVVYTLTASNVCDQPATNVVINNPVPEHMTYVMNSAMGAGTDILFSVDGKSFAKLTTLAVKNADGSSRAATAADIKAIRWTYTTTINPGQSGFVRFRASVN